VEFACSAGDEDTAGPRFDARGDVLGELGQVDVTGFGEGCDGKNSTPSSMS
jgi:hypothetical protein